MTDIKNNVDPTIEEVRDWGYNEDALFIDQDEDLILHSPKYIPILMELISDDNCPKKSYCFSILEHYSALQLAHRTKELMDIVSYLRASNTSNNDLEEWKTKYLSVVDLYSSPREISIPMADDIAHFLTVGNYSRREFKKLGTLDSGYIEYIAGTTSYKEYFYINPKTSNWKGSRHIRLTKI